MRLSLAKTKVRGPGRAFRFSYVSGVIKGSSTLLYRATETAVFAVQVCEMSR